MMPIKSKHSLFTFSLLSLLLSGVALSQDKLALSAQGQGSLTLAKAMELSYQHSFSRLAAEEDLKSSEARQSILKGAYGPKLSVTASRGWIDTDVNKLAGKTLPTGQRYPDEIATVGVSLTQPITQIFANQDRLAAETKVTEANSLQVAVEGNDAKLRGAEAYISALKAVRFLAISRENSQVIEKQKQDASSLRKSGKLSDLDYSRFDLAASEAHTQVIQAEAQLRVASESLHEVLGLSPEEMIQLEELSSVTLDAKSETSERLELKSAESRALALESQLKAQKIDYWPELSAFAQYSRDFAAKDVNANLLGLQIRVPKEDFRDQFIYGFNLRWDVWDWGVRGGRVSEVTSQAAKVRIQKDALASRLRLETASAQAEWNRAQEILRDAEIADKLSADILKAFQVKFKNGLATTTDLLSVQRDRMRAQAQLANANYDLHAAVLRKKRAEGALL